MVFVCVECLHQWLRKEDFKKHFSLKDVKRNKNLFPNPCYNKPPEDAVKSLSEAKMVKAMKRSASGMFKVTDLKGIQAEESTTKITTTKETALDKTGTSASTEGTQSSDDPQDSLLHTQDLYLNEDSSPKNQESSLSVDDLLFTQDLFQEETAETISGNTQDTNESQNSLLVTQDLFLDEQGRGSFMTQEPTLPADDLLITQDSFEEATPETTSENTQDTNESQNYSLLTQDMFLDPEVSNHSKNHESTFSVEDNSFITQDIFEEAAAEIEPSGSGDSQSTLRSLHVSDQNSTPLDDPTIRDVYGEIIKLEELLRKSEEDQKSEKISVKKIVHSHNTSEDISGLLYARSISAISQHPLFKDIFIVDHDTCQVRCRVCKSSVRPFSVQDTSFSATSKEKLPTWFGHFKTSLVRHIVKESHREEVRREQELNEKLAPIRDKIRGYMRFLSYYIIKTISAFHLFPTLLDVFNRCGIYTGDINQTRAFVTALTLLIDKELLKNTKNWLEAQEDKSVTLVTDIGTIFGLVMSVVIFVGKLGDVRLAGCSLTISKTGSDLAELVFNTAINKANIPEELLKRVIGGLCADGVYCKGNQPFKQKFMELLDNPDLVFKWDLMHLLNRAHCKARGLTKAETEAAIAMGEAVTAPVQDNQFVIAEDEDGLYVDLTTGVDNLNLLTRLLDYVQSQSKKWRTGLDYTRLVQETSGKFPRPKIMSSTRVSLYEFEQIFRFLQVKHYWDNPWELELLAQLYCLVLYALKIFMKKVQKSKLASEYVERVFLKKEGKKAMDVALEAGVKFAKGENIDFLLTVEGCEIRDEIHPFGRDLLTFIKKNSPVLKPESLENTTSRTRGTSAITFQTIVSVLRCFIHRFWFEVDKRLAHTELGKDYITYSEAPAETFFSEYKFITDHRPSLGFEMVIALIRIRSEGPGAGTNESHDLVKSALKNHQSHLGERYITRNWYPTKVGVAVKKRLEEKWVWKDYSDFS